MSNQPNDPKHWEELNALVDGELDSARVAEIAARIADDRDAAKAFAIAAALKATTVGLAKGAGCKPRRSWRRHVLAAAVLLLTAGVVGVLFYAMQAPEQRRAELAALPPKTLGLADDVTVGGIRLPNLEPGGLRLERVGISHDRRKPQLEADYVGERGCRARLVVAHAADVERPSPSAEAAQTTRWTVGAFVYTLTSERMDPQRFATVVQIAQAETTTVGPTRVAAAPSDLRNRPCLG